MSELTAHRPAAWAMLACTAAVALGLAVIATTWLERVLLGLIVLAWSPEALRAVRVLRGRR